MDTSINISTVANKPSHAENTDDLAQGIWLQVSEQLRLAYGDAVYRSWLKPLIFEGISNGQAVLSAPTRFMKEWVITNYKDTLEDLLCGQNSAIHSVDIIVKARLHHDNNLPNPVGEQNNVVSFTQLPTSPKATTGIALHMHVSDNDALLENMGAALDPRYTFDNFVVGKPNELAYAAAKRIAESGEAIAGCNPLFLYGGVGLGKTHLMHAIAWHLRHSHPERRVVYLSAEKFMYQFIKALRFNETMAFKEQFRSVDVLMVDDVQFISGKDSTQEEFFHTFNALVDQNKQLVISADRSPSDLNGIEERIRSRLGWGLVADIHTTSFELRYGILESKVEQMDDVQVPKEVLEFLARRITTNIRELEGALTRVVAHATLVGRTVTMESTQEVLQDLLRSCDRRITIDDIQKHVADYYNIKVSDMFSSRRSVAVARPRQVAMYLAKLLTSKSLPEIGRKFGGKDHTTVMHGVKRIAELAHSDNELQEDLNRIQRTLGA